MFVRETIFSFQSDLHSGTAPECPPWQVPICPETCKLPIRIHFAELFRSKIFLALPSPYHTSTGQFKSLLQLKMPISFSQLSSTSGLVFFSKCPRSAREPGLLMTFPRGSTSNSCQKYHFPECQSGFQIHFATQKLSWLECIKRRFGLYG